MELYSQEFYRGVIEQLENGYAYHKIITDASGKAVDYRFLEVNKAFENLTGLKRDEIIGRTVREVLPNIEKDPVNWVSRYEKVALKGKTDEFEAFSPLMNRWYRVKAFAPEHGFFVTVFSDVSAVKSSLQKLETNEIQLRYYALENNRDGLWDWNLSTNEIYFSTMCMKLLGYTQDEPLEEVLEWDSRIHPEDIEPANIAMDKHLAGVASVFCFEHRLICNDESFIWILNRAKICERGKSGQPLRIIGTWTDISDRKQAEIALKESEELHRNLVDLSPDPFVILQHGKYQLVSAKFFELFGYTQADVDRGLSFLNLVRAEDLPAVKQRYQDRLTGKPLSRTFHIDMIAKDGRVIPCETSSALIHYKGHPADLVIIRDISERKTMEENRGKLEGQLRQIQKMEAIGTLTGGIAHDFNNLLTVINGHAEMAIMKLKTECNLGKDIQAILEAGKRAENLTRQLLTFSRKQSIRPEVIDINTIISSMDKMMRRLIGEDIRIKTILDPAIPAVKVAPGHMEQVLVNLIVNARDALAARFDNPMTKEITIRTSRVFPEEGFLLRNPGSQPGSHVLLTVSDNGIGMDAQTKEKIFEPFFTTKGKGKGTGLGMSTVYGIIYQNKGIIDVYSEPGKGTVINIYFPCTDAEQQPPTAVDCCLDDFRGNESILLVEDDDPVRNVALQSLKELGYHVYDAPDGVAAVGVITAQSLKVDLVFTDVVMPRMNGIKLGEELKHLLPGVKILYASGYSSSHVQKEGLVREDFHFLQKPYSILSMAKKIRAVLDESPKP